LDLTKPLSILQAGALAFSFGMLRLRNEYLHGDEPNESDRVTRILEDPDMSAIEKQTKLGAMEPRQDQLVLDADRKAALREKITLQARPFFKRLIELGLVTETDPSAPMPDQFLAAVGDMTSSTGLAKA